MRKVFQTIVDKGKGNCQQAVIASLFEKELNEVPDFNDYGTEWYIKMVDFYEKHGYSGVMQFNPRGDLELIKDILCHDEGVNGYWCGVVKSQTFEDVKHAVVIDKDLNIVHDPNPNQLALKLTPKDIIAIDVVKDDWYIDENGNLVIDIK